MSNEILFWGYFKFKEQDKDVHDLFNFWKNPGTVFNGIENLFDSAYVMFIWRFSDFPNT